MRKFSPRLLVVIFSDVEVAHFGSYALHVAGIRTGDRLAYELWQEIQADFRISGQDHDGDSAGIRARSGWIDD